MADTRQKNRAWTVWSGSGPVTFDGAKLAVLMDIRDELQKLNRVFECENFLDIPFKLDAIKKNTTKRKYNKRTK